MFTGILFRKNNSNGAEQFRETGETPNRRGETTGQNGKTPCRTRN